MPVRARREGRDRGRRTEEGRRKKGREEGREEGMKTGSKPVCVQHNCPQEKLMTLTVQNSYRIQ